MKKLKRLMISCVVLLCTLVVATNLLLISKLITRLASEGEGLSFNLDYSLAWSLVPGRVTIHNLKIDGTDHNVHWEVKFDKVHFGYEIQDLLNRRFHASWFNAEGGIVDVRNHAEKDRPAILARLKAAQTHEPPDPWKIVIQNIRIDQIQTVRMDDAIFEGNSEVTGEFTLRPGIYLEIPQSSWVIQEGLLRSPKANILKNIQGASFVRIHPTQLGPVKGNEIFETMDIHHSIQSHIFDADFLGYLLKSYRPMVYGQTRGFLRASIDVRFGKLQKGSLIESDLSRIELILAGASLKGRGSVRWSVSDSPQGNRAILKLYLNNVAWRDTAGRGKSDLLAQSRYFLIEGFSRDLSLVSPFDDLVMNLKIRNAHIGSLSHLIRHFRGRSRPNTPMVLDSSLGIFNLEGRLVPSRKSFRGKISYRARDLRLSHNSGKTQLQSALKSTIAFRSNNYESGAFEVDHASFALSPIRITHQGKEEYRTETWNASLGILRSRVQLKDSFSLDGRLQVTMSDAKVPVRYLLPDRFWVPIGLFFAPMNDFRGEGDLQIDDRVTQLMNFEARASSGRLSASFLSTSKNTEYAVLLQVTPIELCATQMRGEESGVNLTRAVEKCEIASSLIRSRSAPIIGRNP